GLLVGPEAREAVALLRPFDSPDLRLDKQRGRSEAHQDVCSGVLASFLQRYLRSGRALGIDPQRRKECVEHGLAESVPTAGVQKPGQATAHDHLVVLDS